MNHILHKIDKYSYKIEHTDSLDKRKEYQKKLEYYQHLSFTQIGGEKAEDIEKEIKRLVDQREDLDSTVDKLRSDLGFSVSELRDIAESLERIKRNIIELRMKLEYSKLLPSNIENIYHNKISKKEINKEFFDINNNVTEIKEITNEINQLID